MKDDGPKTKRKISFLFHCCQKERSDKAVALPTLIDAFESLRMAATCRFCDFPIGLEKISLQKPGF